MRDKLQIARLAIHDMLDMIKKLRSSPGAMTLEAFEASVVHRYAAERMLEIVSEASRRIPEEMKTTESDIPWAKIAGIGNVLRHDYDDVRPSVIWNVVQHDLETLETALRRMLSIVGDE